MTLQEVLKRDPTQVESYFWSVLNREEISYKSVKLHLHTLQTNAPNVMSLTEKEMGVITLATDAQGARYGLAIRHAALPVISSDYSYEMASEAVAQALGGISATGADVLAVATDISFESVALPTTQRLYESVVLGLSEYGNAAGVSSVLENVLFDKRYQGVCASVLSLGRVKEDELLLASAPENADNYVIILVGAPTAIDAFSDDRTYMPDALLGGHLLKAHRALFAELKKKQLLNKIAFQAVGQGGIALAAAKLVCQHSHGVSICIENIFVNDDSLLAEHILFSETTERYLLVAPQELSDYIIQHYKKLFEITSIASYSDAVVIGELKKGGEFKAHFKNQCVINLPITLLTSNIRCDRGVAGKVKKKTEAKIALPEDFNDVLLNLLSHENIACRALLHENYDKQEVGLIQPLQDTCYPAYLRFLGVAVSLSQNSRFFQIDPYWGSINAVAEAICSIAMMGAYPQALTQCFYLGNPEDALHMGELSEMVCGVVEACKGFHLKTHPDVSVPVVASSVSFQHVTTQQHPASLTVVGCVGVINDSKKAVGSAFKQAGSCIVLIGERKDECGGSVYYQLQEQLGVQLPQPDLRELERQVYALTEAIDKGLILSARSINQGGIAVCVAKMAISNGFGVSIDIPSDLPQDRVLFSETVGFVLEVAQEHLEEVEEIFLHNHCVAILIGEVTLSRRLIMQKCVDLSIAFAEEAWRNGFGEKVL